MARFYIELLLRDAKCVFSSFSEMWQNVISTVAAFSFLSFFFFFFFPIGFIVSQKGTDCIHFCSNLFNAIVQAELPHPWSWYRVPQAPNCVELLAQALQLLFPKRFSQILSVLNLFMFSDVNLILSVCT